AARRDMDDDSSRELDVEVPWGSEPERVWLQRQRVGQVRALSTAERRGNAAHRNHQRASLPENAARRRGVIERCRRTIRCPGDAAKPLAGPNEGAVANPSLLAWPENRLPLILLSRSRMPSGFL